MDARPAYLRERLSLMFFLQFFIWGGWWIPVATYVSTALRFNENQMTWILATIPLGAIISPLFVGYVADRWLATQHVLAGLHLIGGACLFLAAMQNQFEWMMLMLMISTACFMPTLALCNSLAFRNLDNPDKFPRIAMFGTIGWIVAGLIVGFLLGETNEYFFYLAGAVEITLALYCLTLPHTPPKDRSEAGTDIFGLGAIKLLKEPSFLIFAICAFLVVIPINFYFTGCNLMLAEGERPVPTALMTLGQVTEIFVMFSMAGFIAALGLKNILAFGMLVWAFRYLLFATSAFPLVLLAIIVHGFGYVFVFVGSYIYVDKRAPRHLRASAQSLIAFLMLGVGMLLGTKVAGITLGQFPAVVSNMEATKEAEGLPEVVKKAPILRWDQLAGLDGDKDGQISRKEIAALGEAGLPVDKLTYPPKELERVLLAADNLKEVRTRGDFRSAVANELAVTRPDWIRAKVHRWAPFWLWPALAAAVIGIVYWFGSLATPEPQEEAPEEPAPAWKPEAEPAPAEQPPGEPPPMADFAQGPGEGPAAPPQS